MNFPAKSLELRATRASNLEFLYRIFAYGSQSQACVYENSMKYRYSCLSANISWTLRWAKSQISEICMEIFCGTFSMCMSGCRSILKIQIYAHDTEWSSILMVMSIDRQSQCEFHKVMYLRSCSNNIQSNSILIIYYNKSK